MVRTLPLKTPMAFYYFIFKCLVPASINYVCCLFMNTEGKHNSLQRILWSHMTEKFRKIKTTLLCGRNKSVFHVKAPAPLFLILISPP